jgi:hypothetical protein
MCNLSKKARKKLANLSKTANRLCRQASSQFKQDRMHPPPDIPVGLKAPFSTVCLTFYASRPQEHYVRLI